MYLEIRECNIIIFWKYYQESLSHLFGIITKSLSFQCAVISRKNIFQTIREFYLQKITHPCCHNSQIMEFILLITVYRSLLRNHSHTWLPDFWVVPNVYKYIFNSSIGIYIIYNICIELHSSNMKAKALSLLYVRRR